MKDMKSNSSRKRLVYLTQTENKEEMSDIEYSDTENFLNDFIVEDSSFKLSIHE